MWQRRLVADLAEVEEGLHTRTFPAPPAYRLHDGLRPRLSDSAWVGAASGPLSEAVRGEGGYAERPTYLLALRTPAGLHMEELDADAGRLLAACTGQREMADLVNCHGAWAHARLQAWLRAGAVDDVATRRAASI
ncbi:MAG: hypothetical protein WC876_02245 [Candidatus Thermoplasmatota archaeon]